MIPPFTFAQASLADDDSAREVIVTRLVPAARPMVFKAWTDAKLMADWWGPHAFINPVCEINAQPEGCGQIVMRCPEGVDYPLDLTFHEISAPERLVLSFRLSGGSDDWHPYIQRFASSEPESLLQTITFAEEADQTRLTIRIAFPSSAPLDTAMRTGLIKGLRESLESLSALLSHLQTPDATALLFTPAPFQL